MRKFLIIGFAFSFMVYFVSSQGKTSYDYFTRLSDVFLHGRWWLNTAPPWLNELIPAGNNRYYVAYPPMPAILALPFVAILGKDFPQEYLAHLVGAGIVVLTMILCQQVKKDKKLVIWSGLLVGFGSIVWFLSSVGSPWYLGQLTAAFFLTGALLTSLGKKRAWLVGIALGAAYLSRIHTILSLPLFLYLLKDRNWIKNYLKLGLGILPFVLFNFYYNFVRFGSIFDQAYFLLPQILQETNSPWFIHGVENPIYILNNLHTMFWSFPKILKKFPYIEPSWNGLAIWITTPAFIYSLKNSIKERIVQFSWLSILLISIIILSHGGNGSAQFGYRFAVDFYPILTFLTIKSVANSGLKWHHWFLLILAISVNLWGVVWINKFGWVNF